jgi:glycosyltransferase involved in cell wall biosynthesis
VKVFLSSTSLDAGYGGPAVSVGRLADALANAGLEVGLWSADRSRTVTVANGLRQIEGSPAEALKQFGRPDILHDNGLWLAHNHRFAVLSRRDRIPRVVSTRGMLEPWARRHKRWKKVIAWSLYQRADLGSAVLHHATSDAEAANLRALDLGVTVGVIPNGVDVPQTMPDRLQRPDGLRTALFVGRLYPVKGLPMLIEAWARLRPSGWRLRIAGPDEAGHLAELRRLAVQRNVEGNIEFRGQVDGEEKLRELRSADLFVLPTHSESFGMAIAEALAYGVPVLTTTAAPWPQLSARHCGWRVDPSVEAIVDGLRKATAVDDATRRAMGLQGHEWIKTDFQWGDVARRFVACYSQLT